ncbi:MAG: 2,3-bisphosphoglycerate-independent phosphoglycerate mutase [Bacilli bacterium]
MKKVILLILDGFGIRKEEKGNAIKLANTPVYNMLSSTYPNLQLKASGEAVGLPMYQVGNSEVGHLTIGSGRCVKQNLSIINENIDNKEIFSNEELLSVVRHTISNNSSLHIVGLLSDGGVHSSVKHIKACIDLVKDKQIKNIYLHLFTDGRDCFSSSALIYLKEIETYIMNIKECKVGTITGRYYAMDRNRNWDRTSMAYNAIVYGDGKSYNNFNEAIEESYKENISDEFILPSIIDKESNIKENDGIIFFNFRPERMKQLLTALLDKDFKEFKHEEFNNLKMASIFNIYKGLPFAIESHETLNTLGQYLSSCGISQGRVAETEKYAHVTYFFDGSRKIDFDNYKKVLVPSKDVDFYDSVPQMSTKEITLEVLKLMESNTQFILVNFAAPDMLGHTGNLKATIEAIEICDTCIGKIYEKLNNEYELIITSDHGNCEYMIDENGLPVTSHTSSKVPFIITNKEYVLKHTGSLADIAPTILDIFNLETPKEMSGKSLIKG